MVTKMATEGVKDWSSSRRRCNVVKMWEAPYYLGT